ncbi:extracellular solute-binding protein [Paenibacillus chungangensis]|uniref:Extracellular solute-binding protein n=1 Tax=Paenibacillus chungangensis TaxID=696535 RepID=A0ABW3HU55_9BACL
MLNFVKKSNLIILLCFLVTLAACSNNSNSTAKSDHETPATHTDAKANTETKTEDSEPYSFSLALSNDNWDYARNLSKDDVYTSRLAELSGVQVDWQFFEGADRNVTLATRLASNDMPDVFQLDSSILIPELAGAIDGGAILALNDLLNEYGKNILAAFPEEAWNSPNVSKDGKIFAIPREAPSSQPRGLYVRQDYLDKLKMDAPQTMDEYLAFFEAVKNTDLNGNGKNDEIPLVLTKELTFYNWVFEGYFGVFPDQWQWMDGQALPDLINPKMMEVVAFYKMLYDEGYINQDMFTFTLAQRGSFVLSQPVASYVHDFHHSGKLGYYGNPNNYTEEGAEITVLTGPTTSEGTKRFAPARLPFVYLYIINSKADRPEEIIKYFDWFYSQDPEVREFFLHGVEGHNFTRNSDGSINWDPNAEPNPAERGVHQALFSLIRGDLRASEDSLAFDPNAEKVIQARRDTLAAADDRGIFKYLPKINALVENPQLGYGDGSLYADMFAKVVLGREPIDKAFNEFVDKWKSQGGDVAIKEVTEWYKTNSK